MTRGSIAHVVRHTSAKQEPQSKGVQEIGHTSKEEIVKWHVNAKQKSQSQDTQRYTTQSHRAKMYCVGHELMAGR